mgnify:CR=1 FL=1
MTISYAILTHNEGEYIETLLTFLTKYKRNEDEIVIVDDFSDDELTKSVLDKYKDQITLQYRIFDGDATQKNYLNSLCTKDYILQLDADELIDLQLLNMLPNLLELNDTVDLFIMPRINTVEGLTQEYINRWRWNVNEKGWVNFPDVQTRIYKNSDKIYWVNKVHERIVGFESYTNFPTDEIYCIKHPKTIERQEKQNNYYDTL